MQQQSWLGLVGLLGAAAGLALLRQEPHVPVFADGGRGPAVAAVLSDSAGTLAKPGPVSRPSADEPGPPPECPASAVGGELQGGAEGDPHAHARWVTSVPGDVTPVAASRAENGRTVAQLHAERERLAQQRVRVRGHVVKLTDGIRGRTFLHLRDGSGSLEGRDNDLTVTTSSAFELGQTVEVEGVVQVDQDFGLGYRYAVILDDAARIE